MPQPPRYERPPVNDLEAGSYGRYVILILGTEAPISLDHNCRPL
jgi:hypothetical protein